MTTVHIFLRVPGQDGPIPASGRLEWTPTRRLQDGETIVLPAPFYATLPAGGDLSVLVTANDETWVWRVVERIMGVETVTRYLSIPNVPDVFYSDMVPVDPVTLVPDSEPEAVWYSYVDGLKLEAESASLSAAQSAVMAQESLDLIVPERLLAQTASIEAMESADNSTNSATASASSASSAAQSAILSQDRADSAATSALNAAGSATSALTAQTEAVSAKDTAVAHATGFGIGVVSSLDPTASASAAISGVAPDLKLDLGIPRNPEIGVGEILTVMGPAAPGTVGPQGLTGPKGDPGGLIVGTNLLQSDLNNITTAGIYFQTNASYATTALNYPANIAGWTGTLVVYERGGGICIQEYRPYGSPRAGKAIFTRSQTAVGFWSAWTALTTTRVDQTAGRVIYQWDDLNNREQLTYGDTGWRNIRSLFESVCAANGLTFALKSGFTDPAMRRIGSTIHYRIGVNITGANIATTDFRSAMQPPGFKTDQVENWQIPSSVTGSAGTIHFAPNSWIRFWTAGEQVFVESLATSDPWPTTLPGSAIGTIPNV